MDGTMCTGEDCPVKEKCHRFTAPISEYRQAYFFKPPLEKEDDVVTCQYYWGDRANAIWKQLKDITNEKFR